MASAKASKEAEPDPPGLRLHSSKLLYEPFRFILSGLRTCHLDLQILDPFLELPATLVLLSLDLLPLLLIFDLQSRDTVTD